MQILELQLKGTQIAAITNEIIINYLDSMENSINNRYIDDFMFKVKSDSISKKFTKKGLAQ